MNPVTKGIQASHRGIILMKTIHRLVLLVFVLQVGFRRLQIAMLVHNVSSFSGNVLVR